MARKEYANLRIDRKVHRKLQEYCSETQYSISWFVEKALHDAIDNRRAIVWAQEAIARMQKSTRKHDLIKDMQKDEIKEMAAPAVVVAPPPKIAEDVDVNDLLASI